MNIIILSGNTDKFNVYKKVCEQYNGKFTVTQVVSDIPEPFLTTQENATHKSLGYKSDEIVISDDTDFCLKGLNDQPGVFIKRFMNGFDSEEIGLQYIVDSVKKVGDNRFSTKTSCCVSYPSFGGRKIQMFENIAFGNIQEEVSKSGFSFDKICRYEKQNNREEITLAIFDFLDTIF